MYRIRNWQDIFENNRSRELKRMDWVPIPNRMDGGGYIELLDHPNGASHLGAWLAIVEIASRQKVRGTLPQLPAGIPQDDAGISHLLARISRIPISIFLEVLPRLLDIRVGWIEKYQLSQQDKEIPQDDAGIPQDDAGIPQDDAGIPQDDAALRECARARLIERKGTERTEGNGKNGRSAHLEFLNDPTFTPFVESAYEFWPDLIEEDLRKSWQFTWKKFDFTQKLQAVEKLQARISAREDPKFVSRPPKYLEDGDWKRPPRRAKLSGPPPPEQKPYGCPVCKVVPCDCYEKFIAKESLNGAS